MKPPFPHPSLFQALLAAAVLARAATAPMAHAATPAEQLAGYTAQAGAPAVLATPAPTRATLTTTTSASPNKK